VTAVRAIIMVAIIAVGAPRIITVPIIMPIPGPIMIPVPIPIPVPIVTNKQCGRLLVRRIDEGHSGRWARQNQCQPSRNERES
jgi:hypothetical protein